MANNPASTVAAPVMTVRWFIWSVTSERADFLFGVFNWISVAGAFAVFLGVYLVFSITPIREIFSAGEVANAAKAASDAAAIAYSAGETAGQAQAGVDAAHIEIARQKAIAAQAQLETEKLRKELAWRLLTPSQREQMLKEARHAPGAVNIRYTDGDPEALTLAKQFEHIFRHAGWSVGIGASKLPNEPVFGISIGGPATSGSARLTSVLAAAGIQAPLVQLSRGLEFNVSTVPNGPTLMIGSKPRS